MTKSLMTKLMMTKLMIKLVYYSNMKNDQYPIILSLENLLFPSVELALCEPDGLLAIGGDLRSERIINAYKQGIFPWYSVGEPILWWSPNPRSVIYTQDYCASKSLQKLLRKGIYTFSYDQCFEQVIRRCSQVPREDQNGTWITEEMIQAYCHLHQLGIAHSSECWFEGALVGGLYGLALGEVFFGESMFSLRSNASKAAFNHLLKKLIQEGVKLVDCQVESAHMNSLGAVNIDRSEFVLLLNKYVIK